jgi:hypothetical protein
LRADGSFPDETEVQSQPYEAVFRGEVIALNRMLLALVDRILSESVVTPVIILQADEGPYPVGDKYDAPYPWPMEVERAYYREKTGILSAYLFPDADTSQLHPQITPVNSFRLVLNLYFGASLPILPDRVFALVAEDRPCRFRDVTALVLGE